MNTIFVSPRLGKPDFVETPNFSDQFKTVYVTSHEILGPNEVPGRN